MKVVEITSEDRFRELRPQWDALLADAGAATVFVTWEWMWSWWRSYSKPEHLYILAVFDESNALRGVAPLQRAPEQRYGQRAIVQRLMGDGSSDSDYLDFIVARGFEPKVMECLWAHLGRDLDRGEILLLNEIPASSEAISALENFARARKMIFTKAEVPCATVSLPGGWDEYLATLKPRFRTKVRSVCRHLESLGSDVRFGFCERKEELDRLLPALFDLHTKRWKMDGKPGVFRGQKKQDFYYRLSNLLVERGWLRFSWLEWKGQILACQYGFVRGETYFHLQEGYAPEVEHWNIGMGLRAWTIREFLRAGIREYDFLGGTSRHKADWGAAVKLSYQLQIAKPTLKNTVFCHGPAWEVRLRETGAKVLPEAVLEARRRRIRQSSSVPPGNSNPIPAGEPKPNRVLRAAANCYLRSGAPSVIRRFRERYQLSLPNGKPGFSLAKRTEPAGRILYYHRVNDGKDPFFPAISTAAFEQQMRFIAKHYQVVALSELLSRLDNGTPGTALAITFDDGYRDNLQCALPILRRYNLPATIFLTTGRIDDRRPIWFDQVAAGVKSARREYLDLEVGLPRRFPLQTEANRLAAIQGVFSLLRDLPDEERRLHFAEILKQLGEVPVPEELGMLTWDEVRGMKTQQIEFGGHTVNHPFLSKLTREDATREVRECKQRIEEETQEPARYFAYPNGREPDIGAQSKEVTRDAGYEAAVTTIWGVNYQSTDPMALRRGQPWETDPGVFGCKLDWYQLVNG